MVEPTDSSYWVTIMVVVILSSNSARCVGHKSCLAKLACSEHHKMDVYCFPYESQTTHWVDILNFNVNCLIHPCVQQVTARYRSKP